MTKRKRKNIKNVVKFTALILTPLAFGFVGSAMPKINSLIQKADNIVLYSREQDPAKEPAVNEPYYAIKRKDDDEGTLYANYDISEGFGYIDESAAYQPLPDDSTLNALVNDNPGPKPYPTEWKEGGQIVRNTYGKFSGTTYFNLQKAGQVHNLTSVSSGDLFIESNLIPEFSIELNSDEPQVLIYHTHTTESFEPYVRSFYDAEFNYRTTDETKNVIMVGNEIQAQLEAVGIKTVHSTVIHDYPSYNGAYERSAVTIKSILAEHPSIKVVLDIHRDAIADKNIAYQPFVEIDGKEAAQVMIISGCDDGNMNMPNYMKNFRLASLFQQQMESDYKGMTRPILFDYRKYNQDLSTGGLLIEIGSHGNTLEQVQYSGQLVGASIARTLTQLGE